MHLVTLFVAGALALVSSPALAADTTINFAPILEPLLTIAGTALAAILGWLATRALKWLGIKTDEAQRAALHEAIERGVNGAVAKHGGKLSASARLSIQNKLIADAANYVIVRSPDAAKHFGLDAGNMHDLVKAHLAKVLP